jgi:hypothetical protein
MSSNDHDHTPTQADTSTQADTTMRDDASERIDASTQTDASRQADTSTQANNPTQADVSPQASASTKTDAATQGNIPLPPNTGVLPIVTLSSHEKGDIPTQADIFTKAGASTKARTSTKSDFFTRAAASRQSNTHLPPDNLKVHVFKAISKTTGQLIQGFTVTSHYVDLLNKNRFDYLGVLLTRDKISSLVWDERREITLESKYFEKIMHVNGGNGKREYGDFEVGLLMIAVKQFLEDVMAGRDEIRTTTGFTSMDTVDKGFDAQPEKDIGTEKGDGL